MICQKCGFDIDAKSIELDGSLLCPKCGQRYIRDRLSQQATNARGIRPDNTIDKKQAINVSEIIERLNKIAAQVIPAKLLGLFPTVKPVAFLALIAVAVVMSVIGIGASVSKGGDLSGTYRAVSKDHQFPASYFTFSSDGSFTTSVFQNTTQKGKYEKDDDSYTMTLTETTDVGTTVANAMLPYHIKNFVFVAEKQANGDLLITTYRKDWSYLSQGQGTFRKSQ